MLSRSSSIFAINLLNCLRLSTITCSSSVCVEPIHSKLKSARLLDSVRCARDKPVKINDKVLKVVSYKLCIMYWIVNSIAASQLLCLRFWIMSAIWYANTKQLTTISHQFHTFNGINWALITDQRIFPEFQICWSYFQMLYLFWILIQLQIHENAVFLFSI